MFGKIKNKFKSTDAKILLENLISLSALQLIGMILPLITLPYILRIIGFEKYGIIVLSASLIAYFQSITDFSFRITAVRDVSVFKNSSKKLNLIYSRVILTKGILLLLSLLIISSIVFLYPPFYKYKLIFVLSMLTLVGYALFPEWFFQGIEKMKYITYLNLSIKVIFTLCVFIFIRVKEDYWIYPLLQGCGLIVAGIVGQLILIYEYKLKLLWLPKRIVFNTIKSNFPLFVNQFAPTLYNNTSTFLLGIIGTKALLGVFQAILTVVNLCIALIEILSRVFFPYLNRKKNAFLKYKKMMLSVVSIMILLILTSNKLVFWYLDINYEYSFSILLILTAGLIGYTLYNIFGISYFIIHRKDRLVMNYTLSASIVGFITSFPLIYFLGIWGAAINISFTRLLLGGTLFVKWEKYKNFESKIYR